MSNLQRHPIWKRHFKSAAALGDYSTRELSRRLGNDPISNLTQRQIRMVMIIRDHTESGRPGMLLKELAEKAEASPSSASTMVNALVRKGILERRNCPEDRRAVRISLSGPLQSYLLASDQLLNEKLAGISSIIGEERMRCWSEVVDIIIRELETTR
ncbi:MarR family transcriptional regulator [Oleidesulfovibrio alaskensis]|jgi:DNA-binding MarR family transcriptional regulator|uniref:MarR family transcriptional regulator n=1 Tax=Oleidesulfovibrio alaskensis TaxID=58180 RepID=UPI001A4C9E57|nr:MarR family transcriptional regulator [Oleidesulfovibrio alaskensis]MBL3583003.1 MarR family transcriptional regulator [Oleidesulfovibrio alaskensis]